MKAAIFEKPGLENLKIKQDIEEPKITDHDVLVKVKMAGINPIDHFAISGAREIKPIPHIPGAEIAGVLGRRGSMIFTRIFAVLVAAIAVQYIVQGAKYLFS